MSKQTDLKKLKKFDVKVTCKKCGNTKVEILSTIDSDPEDGAWGCVELYCTNCHSTEEIAQA